MTKRRFWCAHARGCNFNALRAKGFLVLYPTVDDYVFLEAISANEKLLRKQTELGVYFLKKRSVLQTISEDEIDRMIGKSTATIRPAAEILVVGGPGSNLEGTVLEEEGDQLLCELRGFNRTYRLNVDRMDVVLKPKEPEGNGKDPHR